MQSKTCVREIVGLSAGGLYAGGLIGRGAYRQRKTVYANFKQFVLSIDYKKELYKANE